MSPKPQSCGSQTASRTACAAHPQCPFLTCWYQTPRGLYYSAPASRRAALQMTSAAPISVFARSDGRPEFVTLDGA